MWVKAESASRRWYADAMVAGGLVAVLYGLMRLGTLAPDQFSTSGIDLGLAHMPYYAVRSLLRMVAAYGLSILFTFVYGYAAAYRPGAGRFMLPILDILQSIPVLSFMPSVVLALVALFPRGSLGPELASVILIFTGQAWNMTFSFYHSLQTIPRELREVAEIHQMNGWQRFRTLEMPFAAVGLVWNSMMSWAGGWFFLMASEMFSLGDSHFQLPGIGSYLKAAANAGDIRAVLYGVTTLVLVITLLDQLFWRPIVAWAEKFKVELLQSGSAPRSAVLTVLRRSLMIGWISEHLVQPFDEGIDRVINRWLNRKQGTASGAIRQASSYGFSALGILVVLFGIWRGIILISAVPASLIPQLALATGASFLRVAVAMALGLIWTIPVGVAIGSSPRLSAVLQPVTQILASVPATALFPVVLLLLIGLPGGLNMAAVALMLLGTQWYLLFNIIAGASAVPADLKEASASLGLRGWDRWRTLILPAIFPYLVTGLVTASGGAWNATIVSEYVQFQGATHQVTGLGSMIAAATDSGNFPQLLVATIVLAVVVVGINRFVWRRLYRLAETRYSLN